MDDAVAGMHLAAKSATHGAQSYFSDSAQLMTIYQDADYNGASFSFWGDQGTCDKTGYELPLDGVWQTQASSAVGYGNCDALQVFSKDGTKVGKFGLPINYFGDALTDQVSHVHVYQH